MPVIPGNSTDRNPDRQRIDQHPAATASSGRSQTGSELGNTSVDALVNFRG